MFQVWKNSSPNSLKVRFENLPEEGESIIDQYIWGKTFAKSTSNATIDRSFDESRPHLYRSTVNKQLLYRAIKTRKEANDMKKRRENTTAPPRSPTALKVTSSQDIGNLQRSDLLYSEMNNRVGVDVQLDLFEFEQKHQALFVQFGAFMLLPFSSFLGVTEENIMKFLSTLEECYWDNPYHNRIHAAHVAHVANCLVRMFELPKGSVKMN